MTSFDKYVIVGILTLLSFDSSAFAVKSETLFRSATGPVIYVFGTPVHEEITITALTSRPFITEGGAILYFEDSVASLIAEENAAMDLNQDPEFHFDGDELTAASKVLLKRRNYILQKVSFRAPSDSEIFRIREQIGRSLHTIQDYFSHSNAIMVSNSATVPVEYHFPLGGKTVTTRNVRDIKFGADVILSSFTSSLKKTDTCIRNGFIPARPKNDIITTAYFTYTVVEFSLLSAFLHTNSEGSEKCHHGDPINIDNKGFGLNKDTNFRIGHQKAKEAAILATREYVQRLIDEIIDVAPPSSVNETICRIMGYTEEDCNLPVFSILAVGGDSTVGRSNVREIMMSGEDGNFGSLSFSCTTTKEIDSFVYRIKVDSVISISEVSETEPSGVNFIPVAEVGCIFVIPERITESTSDIDVIGTIDIVSSSESREFELSLDGEMTSEAKASTVFAQVSDFFQFTPNNYSLEIIGGVFTGSGVSEVAVHDVIFSKPEDIFDQVSFSTEAETRKVTLEVTKDILKDLSNREEVIQFMFNLLANTRYGCIETESILNEDGEEVEICTLYGNIPSSSEGHVEFEMRIPLSIIGRAGGKI